MRILPTRLARILICLPVLAACAGSFGGAQDAAPEIVTATVLPAPEVAQQGALRWAGGLRLDGPLGGLSGLIVSPEGRLTAVGDRGHTLEARLIEDEARTLIGLEEADWAPLCAISGLDVDGFGADAEALTRLADGDWVVAFELRHRLRRFGIEGPVDCDDPRGIVLTPAMNQLPLNQGLEAVAGLPQGGLVAMAEAAMRRDETLHQAWLWRDPGNGAVGDWTPWFYRTLDGFAPTDAAMLPDGTLLVLERRASLLEGVAGRITRIDSAAIRPEAEIEGAEIGRIIAPWPVDNYEGLAVRLRDPNAPDLYVVSDDNFSRMQRTLLLHLVWDRSGSTTP